MSLVRVSGAVVALLLSLVVSGHASAADLWTVNYIAVDATGASPSAAKEAALIQGRRKAWSEVYRRVTPSTEWQTQQTVSDLDLETMVKSFDISGEKHSSTRYLATVSYVFNPVNVRSTLRRLGVRYSETVSKPILVVALNANAWNPESSWGQAWFQQSQRGRLVPIAIPEGDTQDMSALAAASSAADWNIVKPLAQRYGAVSVLIASAAKSANGIQVTMSLLKPDNKVQRSNNYARQGTEDELALANRTATAIADFLQEDWKRTTSVDYGSQASINVYVPINGLSDWVSVRRSLEATKLVQRIQVDELNATDARIRLDYVGKIEQLQATLAQAGITLVPDDKGNWTLSRNAANAAAPSTDPVIP